MEKESCHTKITSSKFIKAIKVLVEKPNLLNKKICGVENKWIGISTTELQIDSAASELINNLQEKPTSIMNVDLLIKLLIKFNFQECLENDIKHIPWHKGARIAIIRHIIPKNIDFHQSITEVVLIDFTCNKILFVSEVLYNSAKFLPEFAYMIHLDEDKIHLKALKELNYYSHGLTWLNHNLIPTLEKWAKQMNDADTENVPSSSLCLVNVQNYNRTYQNLKRKYGKALMEIWTETTDPQKFIYEDIGIASYLISVWEQERLSKGLKEKQSFLDLGCGNGLLVYILSSEGYLGMGIDIKKRKLWDQFPDHVHLKEDAILPSDKYLYPEYDWLIGNHSDELTPWLPVIAAKSSMKSRYFLIPCCAHDFQSKFQRSKSGISQYAEYLDYIQELGSICGFEVWRDKLRIPSTKRTCFIGQNRTYKSEEWNIIICRINEYVYSKCSSVRNESLLSSENWCNDFKPREPIQTTRNCTQINTQIREKLVNDIGFLLLSQQNLIKIKKENCLIDWNKGGAFSFKSVVSILSKDELKHLKSECGGLQTLLRNHKYIFQIEKVHISLRIPEPQSQRSVRSDLIKTKACWFDAYHPQGCILKNEDCTYIHS